jgi:hypothetical protein
MIVRTNASGARHWGHRCRLAIAARRHESAADLHDVEERLQDGLVLVVAARSTERHERPAVLEHGERRVQRTRHDCRIQPLAVERLVLRLESSPSAARVERDPAACARARSPAWRAAVRKRFRDGRITRRA